MKSIIKTSKRSIIAILALSILLGIAVTCMNVAAMAEDTIVAEATTVVIEETKVATEETEIATEETTAVTAENIQELVPAMARGCDDYWDGQPYNAKSVSDSYLMQNGVNPHDLKYGVLGKGANISLFNIYKDSNGGLWLYSGSGMYIPTYTYI